MPINTTSRRLISFTARSSFPTNGAGAGAVTGATKRVSIGAGVASGVGTHPNPTVTTGSGSFLDPPTAGAISGLTLRQTFDFTGANVAAATTGWTIFDNKPPDNNEVTISKPSNVTQQTDVGNVRGDKYLRLAVTRESYLGYNYTGVQMENAGAWTVGSGVNFYIECRLRWVGYVGGWYGPWLLMYPDPGQPSTPHEIDVCETVNTNPGWITWHYPDTGTTAYTTAPHDSNWHRYGVRVDSAGYKLYYDNALTVIIANASGAASFKAADMYPKLQHYAGGNFPTYDRFGGTYGDLALVAQMTALIDAQSFPKFWDIDYWETWTG